METLRRMGGMKGDALAERELGTAEGIDVNCSGALSRPTSGSGDTRDDFLIGIPGDARRERGGEGAGLVK